MSILNKPPVLPSDDLRRVIALPRRPQVDLQSTRALALQEIMTSALARPNAACSCPGSCITQLFPIQAWALFEASKVGGLLGAIGVGSGKTALDLLTPMIMPHCRKAVVMLPPGQVAQIVRDHHQWGQHFRVPNLLVDRQPVGAVTLGAPSLFVIPYSRMSVATSTALLEQINPDLIIADEAHKLRHKDTATTSRVIRYLVSHPDTRLCAWSGTLTARSIKDYAHLAHLALHQGSPLPLKHQHVEEWSLALDAGDWKADGGALKVLCDEGESLESGYHRRLVETVGVVATQQAAIDASLLFEERPAPKIPKVVQDAISDLRSSWTRPDGEELIDAMQVARSARELAAGFFYRWKFPRGESESTILEWFAARKDWHKELREKLKHRQEHLDSMLLCVQAAIRAQEGYSGPLPIWRSQTWARWARLRLTVEPSSEAVWLDDYLARDVASWALKNRGLVWCDTTAFGTKVSELSGLHYHAGGVHADREIIAEDGSRSVVASIKAHGTGRDGLQRLFDLQLVANPPSSGASWEQLLGRLHRAGQASDQVTTLVYRHTEEYASAIDQAIIQARYIETTLGTSQKLINSSVGWRLELDGQR